MLSSYLVTIYKPIISCTKNPDCYEVLHENKTFIILSIIVTAIVLFFVFYKVPSSYPMIIRPQEAVDAACREIKYL